MDKQLEKELKIMADCKFKAGYHKAASDMLRILERYNIPYGCVREIVELRNKVK